MLVLEFVWNYRSPKIPRIHFRGLAETGKGADHWLTVPGVL